jgi:RNA-directed DNA polymerase
VGLPAGRGRVAQEGIRAVREPSCEPTLHERSQGLRRPRRCHTAMAPRVALPQQGYWGVGEADLQGCCDRIPHQRLLALGARASAEGTSLNRIKKWLQAGVLADGEVRPTGQGTPQGGGGSPLLANRVLNHRDGRGEARGYRLVRDAHDGGVLGQTRRQAEKARHAGTACGEDARGVALNPATTQGTTLGQGCDVLGSSVAARPIRRGGKAEARCKTQLKALPRRRQNREAEGVRQGNRLIRGPGRSLATAFTTCLGQFKERDRWLRRRIRGMQYKRLGKTANRRLQSRHIQRRGLVLCREVDLSTREGEQTDASQGALSWEPPGAGKTQASKDGEVTPGRQRGGAGIACPLPTDVILLRRGSLRTVFAA